MTAIRRFRIKSDIVLDFITPQDQYSQIFKATGAESANGGYVIEFDGKNISIRKETINCNHMIGIWIENGTIEEIK